jgi:hypothetical protein
MNAETTAHLWQIFTSKDTTKEGFLGVHLKDTSGFAKAPND